MKKLWQNIPSFLRNKYSITVFIFLIWMLFFDQNNMVSQWRLTNKVSELKEEKKFYKEEIEKDRQATMELKTNKKTLEKYARENYLMKRDNEDIFLIIEEE
ncbi:MAG: septum formation initiator family protein [Bacteroidales bacterium]|nr:septum formation initiator family protein [Bacteroidales bacterium]